MKPNSYIDKERWKYKMIDMTQINDYKLQAEDLKDIKNKYGKNGDIRSFFKDLGIANEDYIKQISSLPKKERKKLINDFVNNAQSDNVLEQRVRINEINKLTGTKYDFKQIYKDIENNVKEAFDDTGNLKGDYKFIQPDGSYIAAKDATAEQMGLINYAERRNKNSGVGGQTKEPQKRKKFKDYLPQSDEALDKTVQNEIQLFQKDKDAFFKRRGIFGKSFLDSFNSLNKNEQLTVASNIINTSLTNDYLGQSSDYSSVLKNEINKGDWTPQSVKGIFNENPVKNNFYEKIDKAFNLGGVLKEDYKFVQSDGKYVAAKDATRRQMGNIYYPKLEENELGDYIDELYEEKGITPPSNKKYSISAEDGTVVHESGRTAGQVGSSKGFKKYEFELSDDIDIVPEKSSFKLNDEKIDGSFHLKDSGAEISQDKKSFFNRAKNKMNKGYGKIALAVGAAVTAGSLVLGLSNSRGQQSNAQLYGQQPLSY